IRINSFTSAIVFVLAVAYVVLARKGREDPEDLKAPRVLPQSRDASRKTTDTSAP
ncbi:prolipoprotein diacylglyceryl transferase, partial [Rhodococcus sp. SJ]